jgi:hypothetical protein
MILSIDDNANVSTPDDQVAGLRTAYTTKMRNTVVEFIRSGIGILESRVVEDFVNEMRAIGPRRRCRVPEKVLRKNLSIGARKEASRISDTVLRESDARRSEQDNPEGGSD